MANVTKMDRNVKIHGRCNGYSIVDACSDRRDTRAANGKELSGNAGNGEGTTSSVWSSPQRQLWTEKTEREGAREGRGSL